MGQPVKLSDALVDDARQTGTLAERSIAGQIEFWARLGRAVEPLLSGERAMALRAAGDEQPLSQLVASVGTSEGKQRLATALATGPFPHYVPKENSSTLLIRIQENGVQEVGKFVRGVFRVTSASPSTERGKSLRKPKSSNGKHS